MLARSAPLNPGIEPVPLHQQLVKRLLSLVVAAAQSRATLPPHGVDLIDEHQTRGRLLRLVE